MNFFNKINFFRAYSKAEEILQSDGEICFIGRSNSGKSSTINTVVQKKICNVSNQPGRTATINLFGINESNRQFIVDLPGYGFAKTANSIKKDWSNEIPNYFKSRTKQINAIYLICDLRVCLLDIDLTALDVIFSFNPGYKVFIVCTKIDKLSKIELEAQKQKLQQQLIQLGIANQSTLKPQDLQNNSKKTAFIDGVFYISNKNKNEEVTKLRQHAWHFININKNKNTKQPKLTYEDINPKPVK